MKFIINFLFAISILSSEQANGQSKTIVHFDKGFYVSGETVWFKVYLPNQLAGQEFSVKNQIFNPKGNPIFQSFLSVKKTADCTGYFSIPFDFESGIYRFQFSAIDESANFIELALIEIPIYNDLKQLPADLKLIEETAKVDNNLIENIEIRIEKTSHQNTATVLSILSVDKNNKPVKITASASISDCELTGIENLKTDNVFIGNSISQTAKFQSGIYKSGTVFNAAGNLLESPLLAAVDCESEHFYFTKSDQQGKFSLRLPEFVGSKKVQLAGQNGQQISVKWDEPQLPPLERPLQFSKKIIDYLEASRQRKKIYQMFSAVETDLVFEKTAAAKPAWTSNRTFKIQDFEQFPDLAIFCREVIWQLKFSEKHGKYTASLHNLAKKEQFESPPLFLLDGKATFDADFIARLDPASLASIDLLMEPSLLRSHFPALGGGGVVVISSLKNEQNLPAAEQRNVEQMAGLQPTARFPAAAPDGSKPNLRPVAFWSGEVSIGDDGRGEIRYFPTDDLSDFCLKIFGRAADGRLLVFQKNLNRAAN